MEKKRRASCATRCGSVSVPMELCVTFFPRSECNSVGASRRCTLSATRVCVCVYNMCRTENLEYYEMWKSCHIRNRPVSHDRRNVIDHGKEFDDAFLCCFVALRKSYNNAVLIVALIKLKRQVLVLPALKQNLSNIYNDAHESVKQGQQ